MRPLGIKLFAFLFFFSLVVRLTPAAEIGGMVEGKESGRGLPHILVRATSLQSPERSYEIYTDRSGDYILKVPRGRYQVQAVPSGTNYLPGFFQSAEHLGVPGVVELVAEDVFGFADIALELGGSIQGRVTRRTDGTAIENVRVSAESDSHRAVAVTDRSGHYVLRGLPPDSYIVEAGILDSNYVPLFYPRTALAHQAESIAIQAGDKVSGIDVQLELGASIKGRIVSATTNQPLAKVMAIAAPLSGNQAERFAYSDRLGYFSINGLSPGKYRVEAGNRRNEAPESETLHPFITEYFDREMDQELAQPVRVDQGSTVTGVDFGLYRANRIRGRVRSTFYDRPMSDVVVRPVLLGEGKLPIPTATSGSDGRFEVDNLPPGNYAVTVDLPEASKQYVATWFRDQIVQQKATLLRLEDGDTYPDVDFNLHLGGEISGQVSVDDASYPFDPGRLHVMLSTVANEIDGFEPRTYDLAKDGRYAIDGAPIGRFQLAVKSDDPNIMLGQGGDSRIIVVTEGRSQDEDFTLRVGGSIGGRVTMKRSHLPMDKYRILALRLNDPFHVFVKIKDNRYTVPGLPSGKYVVVLVEAVEPLTLEKLFAGPRWYDSRIVDVKKGIETGGVDFIIDETHPITLP